MSDEQITIPAEPQASAHTNAVIAETLSSLGRRLELIEPEQRDQARSVE